MLIQLALMGLLAALLPATIVWVSRDDNKFRKLIWVTLFLTFDLIMFGAFTRLTDSGLGCPDWPGCYGQANPWQAQADISAAEAALPGGPVTVMKAWIEMIHRYFAMAVGVLIIGIMVAAWRRRARAEDSGAKGGHWFSTVLFAFVCLQGAFGAWTVTMKLQPAVVTIHLLLGMMLLGMLAWLAASHAAHRPVDPAAAALRIPTLAALGLLVVQIALGGWVSTNYAVLACTDFPSCQGAWIPQMNYDEGFALWRELGKTADGGYLPFEALTAIHWTHRTFAFVVFLFAGWVAYRALRIAGLRRTGGWMLAAMAMQLGTGIATIQLNWPLAIAVLHNGGAAVLVVLLVMLNYKVHMLARAASTQPSTRLSAA